LVLWSLHAQKRLAQPPFVACIVAHFSVQHSIGLKAEVSTEENSMTPTQTLAKALEVAPTPALAMQAARELRRLEKDHLDMLHALADSMSASPAWSSGRSSGHGRVSWRLSFRWAGAWALALALAGTLALGMVLGLALARSTA